MIKGYKYKLIPNKSQSQSLKEWIGTNRYLYNLALEERILAYEHRKQFGKTPENSITRNKQDKSLPTIKETLEWFKNPPSQTFQQTLKNLDVAFQRFFKGDSEYPTFKKKSQECGIRFPQGFKIIPNKGKRKGYVSIPKIGVLTYCKSREIPDGGKVKSCTIKMTPSGEFSISFQCEIPDLPKLSPEGELGIDRGIVHTLAFSEPVNNVQFEDLPLEKIKRLEKRIAALQALRALKKKFSQNWRKIGRKIAGIHSRIARIRRDFLQKSATKIAKSHGLVVLEKLNVKNMSKSASGTVEDPGKKVAQKSGLNRSILRQGWYMFETMVSQKCIEHGGFLVTVDPKNTSRECSECGHTDKENRKIQVDFHCQSCGHHENADVNAAKVVLLRGKQKLAGGQLDSLNALTRIPVLA